MKWAIVIEKSSDGYGGYVPDLPGLGVVGGSPDEVRRLLVEGIEIYLEELESDDAPRPRPETTVDFVETA